MSHATHTKLRIFVACPEELATERERIRLIANELNKTLADSFGIFLEVVDWTSYIVSAMGRPQQITFDQLPLDTWDIFIGVLWLRFGSPSGATNYVTSEPYSSGTEEEFTAAYALWKQTGRPRIMFFRCTRPASPNQIDTNQLELVKRFFSQFGAAGEHPGFITNYESPESFDQVVQTHLTRVLLEFSQSRAKPSSPGTGFEDSSFLQLPVDKGFLGFFTPDSNEERNRRKRQAINRETRLLRLLAYVGHSYVARVGNRFGDEVIRCLDAGVFFRIILLNPWTVNGLMIAIGESDQKIAGLNFEEDRVDLSAIDVVATIHSSTYYRYSLLQVLDEYTSLKLAYGDNIQMRFTTHDIPATILLTSTGGFFEPYISVNLQQRLRNAFHTFEVQFSSESYYYRNTSTYFDTLWKLSDPFDTFKTQEPTYIQRLRTLYSSKEQE